MEEIAYYHLKKKLVKIELEKIFKRRRAGEELKDILEDMELIDLEKEDEKE